MGGRGKYKKVGKLLSWLEISISAFASEAIEFLMRFGFSHDITWCSFYYHLIRLSLSEEIFMTCIIGKGLNKDIKIYRYMDLAKFLSLIHQKYIFFAKSSSYEDGLEGMPTNFDSLVGGGTIDRLDYFANYLLPSFFSQDDKGAEQREIKRQEVLAKFNERTISTVFGSLQAPTHMTYAGVFEKAAQWVDISCWHTDASNVESMAMWKIYGAGDAAVCIESTLADVISSLDFPSTMVCHADRVTYLDYKKDYIGDDDPSKIYFHKSKYYEFEKEVRIVIYPSTGVDVWADRGGPGTKVSVNPMQMIHAVMVSPASSSWFHELITQIMSEAGFKVPVKKSEIPFRRS